MAVFVNIDGKIYEGGEAKIPVFDRGFLYGDSIYEVIRTYGQVAFALKEHLYRLQRSAEMLQLQLPVPLSRLEAEVKNLVAVAGNRDSYVRIIVTRGEGEISLDPAMATNPHYVIIAKPYEAPPRHLYEEGVGVTLVKSGKLVEGVVPPGAKTGNYLVNLMALGYAKKRGSYEAILVDGAGRITEGTTCNIFYVRGRKVFTPSLECGILAGITRATVLDLCRRWGIPAEERDVYPQDLREADEVFLTSTIRDVMPITAVDGIPVKDGKPGQVTDSLRRAYREYVMEYIEKVRRI